MRLFGNRGQDRTTSVSDNCGSAWIRKTLRFWLAERLDLCDDEVKSLRFFHQRHVEVAAFEG